MMPTAHVLPASFYNRETEIVARELLGADLCVRSPEGLTTGRISETEAYLGTHDAACHAVAGRTARTWHLFGAPGTAYVYFIYGMHWCVNAVTREDGHGSAVLIRAVLPVSGIELMRQRRPRARGDGALTDGPSKLCAAFGIDRRYDGVPLTGGSDITIVHGAAVADADVIVGPRVGISKAVHLPLRFRVRPAG